MNQPSTNQIQDQSQKQRDKSSQRKSLRAARIGLSTRDQLAAGKNLLHQLRGLHEFTRSKKTALYLANDGEIDPIHVMHWIQDSGCACFLPVVQQKKNRNSLLFAEVTSDTQFVRNRFGIPEPVSETGGLVDARHLDLVLLPLVGFDHDGNRIGMGGGFYDTTFAFLKIEDEHKHKHKPVLVGIAHEIQKVHRIDAESWDIPLSTVVTDQHVYRLEH